MPINSVDTYDSPEHNADIINLFSFYEMNSCGIKIVKNIIKNNFEKFVDKCIKKMIR